MADLRKGYWVELLPTERTDGTLAISFMARRTFTIPIDDATIQPLEDEEQPPFLEQDRFDEGDAETHPPTLEAELVPEKARCDVLVVGKTYAPSGQPEPEWECAIQIGTVLRRLKAMGPRKAHYTRPRKRQGKPVPQPPSFDKPTPVKEVPLTLALAYGGQTWVIPDAETLAIQRQVNEVVDAEIAEEKAKKEAAKAAKKEAEAKAKKEAEEKAFLEAPVGEASAEDEKLKRAWGDFGYDKDGVRIWGEATSKRGTAVMDLDAFAAWQAAQEEAEAGGGPEQAARDAAAAAKRANAAGEVLEIDDGVQIMDADAMAAAVADAAADQAALKAEQAAAAAKRRKESVQQNDGTRVLDISELDDEEEGWDDSLKERLKEEDAERIAALEAERKARQKELEEKLAEFPKLPCPTNPFGVGFIVSNVPQLVEGMALPQLEDPDAPLTPKDLVQDIMALDRVPLPAGLSTWPRHASPRVDLAGSYPSDLKDYDKLIEEQKKALDLEEEDDVRALRELDRRPIPGLMQAGWFNSAPPTLQLDGLHGDEEVTLTNLTKDGTLYFRLPGRALEAELDRGNGVERTDLVLDTLVIEPDARQVSMIWRAHFPFADWDELETYPNLVGWVLDLDVKDRRRRDWEEQTAKARGDGTAVIDISELDDGDNDYWRSISDERKAKEAAAMAAVEGTQALDIERMGLYREVEDDGWVKEASDGTVDVDAEAKKAADEEAWLEKKQAAVKELEAQEKAEKERREEVAAAVQSGKKIPPKDADKTPAQLKKAKAARAKAGGAKGGAKGGATGGSGPSKPPPKKAPPKKRPAPRKKPAPKK